ncbi:hypothetical protein C8R46DRAFT_1219631 [Mycena filopes]|nr:hypothetical protein C8R46DRAFT_1219631 [Mycena filopes]
MARKAVALWSCSTSLTHTFMVRAGLVYPFDVLDAPNRRLKAEREIRNVGRRIAPPGRPISRRLLEYAPSLQRSTTRTDSRRDLASALYDRCVDSRGQPGVVAQASISLSYCYSDLKAHQDALEYGELAVQMAQCPQDKKIAKKPWTRVSYRYRDAGNEAHAVEQG